MTAAQARAFAIADNRLTENSTWDDKLLGEIFRDLASLELDFDLDVTGFSVSEIDLRIEEVTAYPESASDPADSLTEIADGPPVSKQGDLWTLGNANFSVATRRIRQRIRPSCKGFERMWSLATLHLTCRSMGTRRAMGAFATESSQWRLER